MSSNRPDQKRRGVQPRIVAIVQARVGSTRLPGKVLRPLLGRPMLARVIERLRMSEVLHRVVVATTHLPHDDEVARVAQEEGAGVFRGDETDVLGRYVGAARAFDADVIVRVTADCPLIDAGVIDQVVSRHLTRSDQLDYVSNTIERTYPRGLDVEVLPRRVLEHLDRVSDSPPEREHVTLHLLHHQDRFRIDQVRHPIDHSTHYWTVDTEEDFQLVAHVYEALYPTRPRFMWTDVLQLFETRPELYEINRMQAAVNDAKLRALDRGA